MPVCCRDFKMKVLISAVAQKSGCTSRKYKIKVRHLLNPKLLIAVWAAVPGTPVC